jgi:hypothetical protein
VIANYQLCNGDEELELHRNRQESQMRSSLIAVVLCFATQIAAAQCVNPVPVAQHSRHGGDLIQKKQAAAPAPAHAGGELIKTASAGTHDELPRATRNAPAVAAAAPDDEEHRHSGPAMLLAALALMSAIALRRFRQ